jgi:hypothetical protein
MCLLACRVINLIMEGEIMIKQIMLVGLLLLMPAGATTARADGDRSPSLLIYISPAEYSYETRIGVLPYYSFWVLKGPILERAAMNAIKPHFDRVELCQGSNTAEAIIWLTPQLTYNPTIGRYYAQVRAQFYLGNAKRLTTLNATGHYDGFIGSSYAANQIQQAFEAAMQEIMRQYAADAGLQEAIRSVASSGLPGAPCALVGMIPNP